MTSSMGSSLARRLTQTRDMILLLMLPNTSNHSATRLCTRRNVQSNEYGTPGGNSNCESGPLQSETVCTRRAHGKHLSRIAGVGATIASAKRNRKFRQTSTLPRTEPHEQNMMVENRTHRRNGEEWGPQKRVGEEPYRKGRAERHAPAVELTMAVRLAANP